MGRMRRTFVGLAAAAALVTGTPAARAVAPVSITLAFTGTVTTSGPGLCWTGLVPSGGACVVAPTTPPPPVDWVMTNAVVFTGVDDCRLTVVFDDKAVHEDPCSLSLDGRIMGVLGLGPWCGLHSGNSATTPLGASDQVTANGDTFPLGMSWSTTAGGAVLIGGSIGGLSYRGWFQHRPAPSPTQNCVTAPATSFQVVGALQTA